MAPSTANVGDTVELKDKDGGFTDPVTGFDISRDQKLKLTDPIGARTHEAIVSGGLLVVSGKRKNLGESSDQEPQDDGTGYPADIPGREALVASGVTFEQFKELKTDEVAAIKGVGPKTVEALKEWAKTHK